MIKFGISIFLLNLSMVAIFPTTLLANDVSINTDCNPCTVGQPVSFTPAQCTPTPVPCTEESYIKKDARCSYNCVKKTCGGVVQSDVCGSGYNCNYCAGVRAYQQCGCSGGIVSGLHSVSGRLNFYIYGWDGRTVCFSESCLRCGRSFDPEANVMLSDGSYKAVEDLSVDDTLISPTGKSLKIKEIVQSGESNPMVVIRAGELSLTVTSKHIVQTERGLVTADTLTTDDLIKNSSGQFVKVTTISRPPVKLNQQAYGIVLDVESSDPYERLLIGDGIVVGDYVLEKTLAK